MYAGGRRSRCGRCQVKFFRIKIFSTTHTVDKFRSRRQSQAFLSSVKIIFGSWFNIPVICENYFWFLVQAFLSTNDVLGSIIFGSIKPAYRFCPQPLRTIHDCRHIGQSRGWTRSNGHQCLASWHRKHLCNHVGCPPEWFRSGTDIYRHCHRQYRKGSASGRGYICRHSHFTCRNIDPAVDSAGCRHNRGIISRPVRDQSHRQLVHSSNHCLRCRWWQHPRPWWWQHASHQGQVQEHH